MKKTTKLEHGDEKKFSRSKKQCTERLLEIGNNDGRMAKKKKKAKSQESEIKAKKKFSFHLKNLSLFAIYTQNIATQTMNIFLITIFFSPTGRRSFSSAYRSDSRFSAE